MLRQSTQKVLAIALAISIFTAMSVAPVAASESIDLGGEEGVSIGTDGISLGGEEGVDVGLDPQEGVNASVGGDEGVNVGAGTDGVDVGAGGEEGVNVGAGTDGVSAGAAGENVSVGTDGVETSGSSLTGSDDGSPLELTDGAGGLSPGEGGLEDVSSSLGGISGGDSGLGVAQDSGSMDALEMPTDATDLGYDTNELPMELRPLAQILQAIPTTDAVGPEDVPVGDEDAQVNVCEPLDVGTEDLGAGSIPGLDTLPTDMAPPGVPTNLLSTEAVLGILLGFAPAPCDVLTPNDPPVDPTNLPDEPQSTLDVSRFGQFDGGGVGLIHYDSTLNESGDGPGISGYGGMLATPEYGDIDQELILNDGEKDYGIDPRLQYNNDSFEGEAVLILLGNEAGIEGECNDLTEFSDDLSFASLQENPLGPCDYTLVGLPNLVGPQELVGILTSLGDTGGEPPVNLDALPVNPDALLNY